MEIIASPGSKPISEAIESARTLVILAGRMERVLILTFPRGC